MDTKEDCKRNYCKLGRGNQSTKDSRTNPILPWYLSLPALGMSYNRFIWLRGNQFTKDSRANSFEVVHTQSFYDICHYQPKAWVAIDSYGSEWKVISLFHLFSTVPLSPYTPNYQWFLTKSCDEIRNCIVAKEFSSYPHNTTANKYFDWLDRNCTWSEVFWLVIV